MKVLKSKYKLDEVIPNMASLLLRNAEKFGNNIALQHRINGSFTGYTYSDLFKSIYDVASNLRNYGFERGDKVVIYSRNRIELLLLELALMASGGISVPIFFNYSSNTAQALIKHSGAKFIAVGDSVQLGRINPEPEIKHVFVFDKIHDDRFPNLTHFSELLKNNGLEPALDYEADSDEIILNMYTSGTMGNQKCVQLTHKNILSQQAAIKQILKVDVGDRFLSYLRWHHSFGGIFEKFSSIYNGASLALESGNGLYPEVIMENWKIIKPTVFFSVPMIYQALIDLVNKDKKLENEFFHPGLKFVFTAAAPLPFYLSKEFEKRKIPIIEGWGLTETSPCCTLTDPSEKREPGLIGKPIPGVTIAIADDGELLVKGPNVMKGYYDNDEANKAAFNEDGWYCTGDIGELTKKGLKLITRKDRIFKLSNAEKVIPTELEGYITGKCHYISHVLVEGNGKNYPVALLFPDRLAIMDTMNGSKMRTNGCICPDSLNSLSECLCNCLKEINYGLKQKFSRIKVAMLIDDELKVDNATLTPSLKLAPNNVKTIYKNHIEKMYGSDEHIDNVFIIYLDEKENIK